jgi:hypothetical protein
MWPLRDQGRTARVRAAIVDFPQRCGKPLPDQSVQVLGMCARTSHAVVKANLACGIAAPAHHAAARQTRETWDGPGRRQLTGWLGRPRLAARLARTGLAARSATALSSPILAAAAALPHVPRSLAPL